MAVQLRPRSEDVLPDCLTICLAQGLASVFMGQNHPSFTGEKTIDLDSLSFFDPQPIVLMGR